MLAQTGAPLQTHAAAPDTPVPAPTLHAQARLVVVDVVVTDKKNNPIHGLKQSDFTLLEKNTPQKISYFQEHTALSTAEAAKFPPIPRMPPGIFTNYAPTPVNSAVNILLLDALNTPITNQSYVRSQVLNYLKQPRPGTNVAIFGLTTQLRMLQGFTSDPEVLRQIVLKQLGKGSVLLDDPVSGSPSESITDQMGDLGAPMPADVLANMQTFENIQQSFQLQLRAKYTLDAMDQMARYLSGIPGRKNLIWFSGSFPLNILPDTTGTASDPFAAIASSEEEYRETTNLLARSQVAVYPIDARGLMVSPSFSAAQSNSRFARNPATFNQSESKFFAQTADEHSTMQRMAEDTGGRAFYNTNGLGEAVSKAIDAGSNYYTLAYSPLDPKWTGEFRSIQVKLEESGRTLAYRRGYYAIDPDSTYSAVTPGTDAAAASSGLSSPSIQKSMVHGTPGPTQILFKVRVLPASMQPEEKLAERNVASATRAKPPYIRYKVDLAADPHDLTFTRSPDGMIHGRLELISLVYAPDGELVNSNVSQTVVDVTKETFQQIVRGGLPLHQEISVPVKGEYSLRIGVHDFSSRHIGATELPVASIKNLPPAPPPVPPTVPATAAATHATPSR